MKFAMSVDMDNAAFTDDMPGELGDIFTRIAYKVRNGDYHVGHTKSILDTNGNRVGSWKITEEN